MTYRFIPKSEKSTLGRNRGEQLEMRQPNKAGAEPGRRRSNAGRGRGKKKW